MVAVVTQPIGIKQLTNFDHLGIFLIKT